MSEAVAPVAHEATGASVPSAVLETGAGVDRDLSILAFNERVLDWARRTEVPLLERLRYLCIVSSNLDEFFEVRVADALAQTEVDAEAVALRLEPVWARARALVQTQYQLYNQALLPELQRQGLRIVSHGERNAQQRRWVRRYFEREVQPLLVPVGIDPAHPLPQVANKSLNFIVHLRGVDAFGKKNNIAIVKVPRSLPRVIEIPAQGEGRCFALLSSLIRSHLAALFPGREVLQFSQFRVTRHSDLALDEEDTDNLRTAVREGLAHRHYGRAVRLEVSASCPAVLSDFLLQRLQLPMQALFRVNGPVNLVRLQQLIDLGGQPQWLFAPLQAGRAWPPGRSLFQGLRQQDVLVHQPFQSFETVVDFLREAVRDPQVLAIKQTIYRAGNDPVMIDLLCQAVRRGKEVTAVVELKARFDEEANINWAEQLEAVGVQVVYGVVGLKTHAKMLLVTRREAGRLVRYGHLSTGNYNPRTAQLYTDLSFLTADPGITADMDAVFGLLASQNPLRRMRRLWVAPFDMQVQWVQWLQRTERAARSGGQGRVVLKMNALTDPVLIQALLACARAGVRIDLIVRGACLVPPGTPGVRVRSVIGRFLEHSRVFYFRANAQEALYLASADGMSRNLQRRVEVAWPVLDRRLRQRIVDECLLAYMYDSLDAWTMQDDGRYASVPPDQRGAGAQMALSQRYMRTPPV